jgi:HK97 family phage portal protein
MGLLQKLAIKNYTMGGLGEAIGARIGGIGSHSGIQVTETKALSYITVFSCVRVLAETLGSLPIFIYKERAEGGNDKARDHPLFQILHDLPNDEMTSSTFRETQMGHLALSGNCYASITRNRRGEVIDLYPIPWNSVQVRRNKTTKKVEYLVTDNSATEVFPAEKILHIPGFGFDGLVGYSPIRLASEAVGLGLAAAEFAARFYSQGMAIGGILEHPATLSTTALDNLKTSFIEKGAGLANAHVPIVLEEGMKFNRIPMPFTDAQFLETRKFTRDEICGLFRIPPHMIANLERSTNNNIEHQSLEFVKYTMLPYITRWEQAINWKLFTPKEREQGFYAKFNVEGILRGDYKSRQEGLAVQRQNGVINADEWRALEEMNPQPGGTGEVYLVNGNMIPVDIAAKREVSA